MLKYFCWIAGLILCFSNTAIGQSFGGNVWSQKWLQLNQEDIRVIYPEGFEAQAQRVFSVLGYLHTNHRNTVGDLTDRISLVLNNRSNISNGYVGLSPFRSEFFSTPLQNNFALGSLPWLDLLAVHEYRHVLQFSNARRGLNRFLSVAFGQTAFAGGLNVSIPDWYFEGDAVLAESAMTPQGRGRIPHFLRAFKAYEAEGTRFSYDKIRNGSFKDFIPDHYRYGYMMNKFGAEQHGEKFWGEVLADAGSYKGLFYPFSNAIRARTGKNVKEFYSQTFDQYQSKWKADISEIQPVGNSVLTNSDKVFTNYRFPFELDDGTLIYLKSGLRDINTVVSKKGDSIKKLFALGFVTDPYIDVRANKVSWSEFRFHPSRGNIDYSVVMTYDLKTGAKKQVSSESRFFAPSMHPEGQVIAVVEVNHKGESQIKIISSRDGLVLDSLSNNNEYFITYPKWNTDGSKIYYAARNSTGQMAICVQSIDRDQQNNLTEWSYHPIGVPFVGEDYIYFSRSDDKAEHIFRVNDNGEEQLIIESRFGDYFPSIGKENLYFSSFTSNGIKLKSMPLDEIKAENSTPFKSINYPSYELYGGELLSKIPEGTTTPKKYSRVARPINIHSWGVTADNQSASLLIESDNILNNVSLYGGLQYIFDDTRTLWTAGARLGFIFPHLLAEYTLESRSFIVPDDGTIIDFNESTVSLGAQFPFNLSSGPYLRSLLPHYSLEKIYIKGQLLNDFDIFSQELGVIFLNRRLKATQDVLAKFSQFINLNYRGSLDDLNASQLDVETEYTFPGIISNHALRIELDYKSQPRNSDYNFPNRFDFARGNPSFNSEKATRVGINYHFPIIYPEFGILGVAYLQRIQGNIFYDYSTLKIAGNNFDFSSTGMELLFDTKVFNILPVTFGMRYARALDLNTNEFEFFVPFYRF